MYLNDISIKLIITVTNDQWSHAAYIRNSAWALENIVFVLINVGQFGVKALL